MPTEICITIDTEFSIAGAFSDPQRYEPLGPQVVNCAVDGRDEGLGFLLDAFGRYGVPATFFVEALQTAYFGDAPMGEIAARIRAAGHDVQLHLHPCWLHFRDKEWRRRTGAPSDSCAGRSADELDEMIGLGLDTFKRWGAPRPVALRSGGLETDRALYRAMARNGIPLGSNLGIAIYRPADSALHLAAGRHQIEGVCELPVLAYYDLRVGGRSHAHNLTITGCSRAEIESLLWQAHAAGLSPVVILTHPFEYVKVKDFRYARLRRNRVNQARLIWLLEFLRAHQAEFSAVTFAGRKEAWLAAPPAENRWLSTPRLATAGRIAQNALNDHVWHF